MQLQFFVTQAQRGEAVFNQHFQGFAGQICRRGQLDVLFWNRREIGSQSGTGALDDELEVDLRAGADPIPQRLQTMLQSGFGHYRNRKVHALLRIEVALQGAVQLHGQTPVGGRRLVGVRQIEERLAGAAF